jgi:hypothetical protein
MLIASFSKPQDTYARYANHPYFRIVQFTPVPHFVSIPYNISNSSTEIVSGKTWSHNPVQHFSIPVDLTINRDQIISTFALLDCGCSENFMQETFAKDHGIPILPLPFSAIMIGLKGHECLVTQSTPMLRLQIVNHQEDLLFLIAPIQSNNFALRIP